jgi:hydrogenase expression/formation protein HypD
MVRVPGRYGSLGEARSQGAKVEIVVSADKVVDLAKANPDLQVVFLAVGFETTTPATALAVLRAQREKVTNFSVLAAHKLVLPALAALLTSDVRIDGFLMPGHVSVILGYGAYEKIAIEHGKPCVVAGFDALQIIKGLLEILRELASGKPQACTVYPTVHREGNPHALKLFEDVFQPCDARWRAIGVIPKSGLELKPEFAAFDAAKKFELPEMESYELPGCRCGEVITGRCSPFDCPLFGRRCTPRDPVGPCMVSSEGACAAAYKYERVAKP